MSSLHLKKSNQCQTRLNNLALKSASSRWKKTAIQQTSNNSQIEQSLKSIAPTLASLSQQGRWIVLIGAPKSQIRALLDQHGIAPNKVLLVHPKDQIDALWAMEQALMSGTSSAVLGWPGTIEQRDMKRLKIAAKHSSAVGFLFQQSQSGPISLDNQLCQQLNLNNIKHSLH